MRAEMNYSMKVPKPRGYPKRAQRRCTSCSGLSSKPAGKIKWAHMMGEAFSEELSDHSKFWWSTMRRRSLRRGWSCIAVGFDYEDFERRGEAVFDAIRMEVEIHGGSHERGAGRFHNRRHNIGREVAVRNRGGTGGSERRCQLRMYDEENGVRRWWMLSQQPFGVTGQVLEPSGKRSDRHVVHVNRVEQAVNGYQIVGECRV
jgi:hypothetical protein